MILPDFKLEKKLISFHSGLVAIDEAGRGPVAGPLTVASVFINRDVLSYENLFKKLKVRDSKQISENTRENLRKKLNSLVKFYTVHIPNSKIDKLGIQKSFYRAVEKIEEFWTKKIKNWKTLGFLIDFFPYKPKKEKIQVYPIKFGDKKCLSISLASVFAKTERDRLMRKIHKKYPQYNFWKNKGYATKEHLKNIAEYGLCKYHRKTFLKNLFNFPFAKPEVAC